MVTRIYCKKFLDQSDNPLDLHLTGNFHYFYGYNGSGKSVILRLMGALLQLNLKEYDFLHSGGESLVEVGGYITIGYSSEDKTITHKKRGWEYQDFIRSHTIAMHCQDSEDTVYSVDEELGRYNGWQYPRTKGIPTNSHIKSTLITHDGFFRNISLTIEQIDGLLQNNGVTELAIKWFNEIWPNPTSDLHFKTEDNGHCCVYFGPKECEFGLTMKQMSAGMLKVLMITASVANFIKNGGESVLIVDDFHAVLDRFTMLRLIAVLWRICKENYNIHIIFTGHTALPDCLIPLTQQIECKYVGFETTDKLL